MTPGLLGSPRCPGQNSSHIAGARRCTTMCIMCLSFAQCRCSARSCTMRRHVAVAVRSVKGHRRLLPAVLGAWSAFARLESLSRTRQYQPSTIQGVAHPPGSSRCCSNRGSQTQQSAWSALGLSQQCFVTYACVVLTRSQFPADTSSVLACRCAASALMMPNKCFCSLLFVV